jgi:hypothetical protein
MDTKVKKVKTVNTVEEKMMNYLNKCSKHIFVDKTWNDQYDNYYRILPIKKDDRWYCITIMNNITKNITQVDIYSIDKYVKLYENNAKNVLKNNIWYGMNPISVKYNKKLREQTKQILEYLNNCNMNLTEYNTKEQIKNYISKNIL